MHAFKIFILETLLLFQTPGSQIFKFCGLLTQYGQASKNTAAIIFTTQEPTSDGLSFGWRPFILNYLVFTGLNSLDQSRLNLIVLLIFEVLLSSKCLYAFFMSYENDKYKCFLYIQFSFISCCTHVPLLKIMLNASVIQMSCPITLPMFMLPSSHLILEWKQQFWPNCYPTIKIKQ